MSRKAQQIRDIELKSYRSIRDGDGDVAFSDEDDADPHILAPRRSSDSSTQSFELYTPDEERAVLKKLDTRLVLFMSFLYMLSFLDRSSRGFFLPSTSATRMT